MKRYIQFGTLFLSLWLTGCSTILDPDREFADPITGSIIIAKDVLTSDTQDKSCDQKPKSEQEACRKQVDALSEAIANAKKKNEN